MLKEVYGALTAKENQSVVRSVVIFGVSALPFSPFFLWRLCSVLGLKEVKE